jgi:hypothetical protein
VTQPPKEKSLVVDVLTRYHQEYPHGEFTHDYIKDEKHCHLCKLREDRNKAIRIAERDDRLRPLYEDAVEKLKILAYRPSVSTSATYESIVCLLRAIDEATHD